MNTSHSSSKRLWIPLVVGVLSLIVWVSVLGLGEGKHSTLARTLTQWDGQHYLSIADSGYEKFPCDYNPAYICGNVGWFPFYPLLGGILGAIGIPVNWAMIAISWLAFLAAFMVLYELVARRWNDRVALGTLVALVLFPSSFYFATVFPYSVLLLLSVLALRSFDRKDYRLLPLWTGLMAVTYPSGIVIGLPVLWVLISRWSRIAEKDRYLLGGSLASIGVTLFMYCSYYWYRFGDFFLYLNFQSQSYYAHEAAFPLWTIFETLTTHPTYSPVPMMLLFVTGVVVLFYRRAMPATWLLLMFAFLLFTPTMGTCDCYYRHIVVAFPLAVMVALCIEENRRRWLLPLYAAGAIYMTYWLYLPAFRMGQLM